MYHPEYNDVTMRNDLALLMLDTPVDTSVYVPTCLPASDTNYTGSVAWVLGWGHTRDGGNLADILQELRMTIVHDEQCFISMYNDTKIFPGEQLCAGGEAGKDTCQGDSGGPLQRYNTERNSWDLAGVTSWGKGCAVEGLYGVYTKISREYEKEIRIMGHT